ncbi:hypothetical protein N306_02054, partial [Opisthocomus hoazin]
KMQVFLPDLMELLQNENEDIKMKALVVMQKLMGHLEKAEASPIAVQLAEKLLPLFDEELSQLRELSISLCRDMVSTVVGNSKRQMRKNMQMGLLPLLFHMSDETQSMAK